MYYMNIHDFHIYITRLLALLPAALMALSSMAASDNYFRPGMKWVQEIRSFAPGASIPAIETSVILRDTVADGFDAMVMMTYTDTDPFDTEYMTLLRTEESKVYFKCPDSEYTDWYLMYDFDMRVGATCEVYESYSFRMGYEPTPVEVMCISRHRDDRYCGLPSLRILRGTDPTPNAIDCYSGFWIAGVGSELGVHDNCTFGMDGSAAIRLIEASLDGEVIYKAQSLWTGVNATSATTLSVSSSGRTLRVTGATDPVSVYDCGGNIIHWSDLPDFTLPLPAAGIYIVAPQGGLPIKTAVR